VRASRLLTVLATAFALLVPAVTARAAALPDPDHVVVVVMENKAFSQIIGSSSAPYINGLAAQGANFTQSFAVTHPSQPNYIALFSGSTQGVTNDTCPRNFTGAANLGNQLLGAGRTFTGYSETMPSDGFTGCSSPNGLYQRKHNPWVDFDNVPAATNRTFAAFPSDFATLPALSFVVPNMCDDMHDCPVSTGDTWLRDHIDPYAQWAKAHNSLLVLTFDEDDSGHSNQITTVVVGQQVKPGSYAERIDHYTVLRTLEDIYGLPALGNAAQRTAITDIWQ
jgi:phosphatidylinositol-3-phosphatase